MPENEGLAKNAFYSPYCCVYNTTVNSMGFREKNITPEKLKHSQCTGRLFLRTHGSVAVGDVHQGLGHPQEHLSLCWHFLTRGLGCAARSSRAGHGHDAKTRPQHLHCVFPLRWIGKIKKNESVFETIQHCLGLNGRTVFQGIGKARTQIFRAA